MSNEMMLHDSADGGGLPARRQDDPFSGAVSNWLETRKPGDSRLHLEAVVTEKKGLLGLNRRTMKYELDLHIV